MVTATHSKGPGEGPVFALPRAFDTGQVLPAPLRKRGDDARWVVDQVSRKMAYGDTDEDGYARLHSAVLKRVMAKRTYAKVIEALVDGEVFDPPAPYCVGIRSKGYRLSETCGSDQIEWVAARDPHLIERVHREWGSMRQEQERLWLPIDHALDRLQHGLTILPSADVILAGLGPEAQFCQRILVENIRRRHFKHTVRNTGRRFNSITGLKRELRKTLRLNGEPIAGVDICACQPALLAVLIRLSGGENVPTYIQELLDRSAAKQAEDRWCGRRGVDASGVAGLRRTLFDRAPVVGADFARFESIVLEGRLYEDLMSLCMEAGVNLADTPRTRKRGTAREKAKRFLLRDVLAKSGRYVRDFERVFRDAYPSVYGFVRWVNQLDHGELIRTLQRLESLVVVEHVAPRLVDTIPVLTLHDALYARTRDIHVVEDAFHESFDELGLRLKVKPELAGDHPPADKQTVPLLVP